MLYTVTEIYLHYPVTNQSTQAYDDLRECALTLLPPRHCMYGVAPGTTPMKGANTAYDDDEGTSMYFFNVIHFQITE